MDLRLFPDQQFANLSGVTIERIISAFVILILIIASLAFVFALLVGGIKWILSGGKKDKTDEARAQILNALIGLLIVYSAWAVISFIELFFGVRLLEFDIPSAAGF